MDEYEDDFVEESEEDFACENQKSRNDRYQHDEYCHEDYEGTSKETNDLQTANTSHEKAMNFGTPRFDYDNYNIDDNHGKKLQGRKYSTSEEEENEVKATTTVDANDHTVTARYRSRIRDETIKNEKERKLQEAMLICQKFAKQKTGELLHSYDRKEIEGDTLNEVDYNYRRQQKRALQKIPSMSQSRRPNQEEAEDNDDDEEEDEEEAEDEYEENCYGIENQENVNGQGNFNFNTATGRTRSIHQKGENQYRGRIGGKTKMNHHYYNKHDNEDEEGEGDHNDEDDDDKLAEALALQMQLKNHLRDQEKGQNCGMSIGSRKDRDYRKNFTFKETELQAMERENRRLLSSMMSIHRRGTSEIPTAAVSKSSSFSFNTQYMNMKKQKSLRSSHGINRNKRDQEIYRQNLALAKRLESVKSNLPHGGGLAMKTKKGIRQNLMPGGNRVSGSSGIKSTVRLGRPSEFKGPRKPRFTQPEWVD